MQRFKNLLVLVNSESSEQVALERATELAEHTKANITVADVVREFGWLKRIATPKYEDVHQQIIAEKQKLLETLAERPRGKGIDVRTAVLSGKASNEIVREVLSQKHDLVIKAAKGAGWFKGYFGETAMHLLRKCPCPVWLTKAGRHDRSRRVMAAVDASLADEAHAALNVKIIDLARSFCRWEDAQLDIVQAWHVYGEEALRNHMLSEEFEDLMQRSRREAKNNFDELLGKFKMNNKSPGVHLLHGDPSQAIPQFAQVQQTDVIVMGTIARTGLAGALMGNTAEAILGRVNCSVLAVKPDNFVSPIRPEG